MMTVSLDTLAFVQQLEAAGIERRQAEAIATGTRDMITAEVATKADKVATKAGLDTLGAQLEKAIAQSEARMTGRLMAAVAAAVALIKVLDLFIP